MLVIEDMPECCKGCPNNPANNPLGGGVCHCVSPYMNQSTTFIRDFMVNPTGVTTSAYPNDRILEVKANTSSEMVVYC